MKKLLLPLLALAILLTGSLNVPRAAVPQGQTPAPVKTITPPKEHFGFNIGDDYCLANYKQFQSYLRKLEGQTDRLKVVKIGVTEEGRDQLMALVTSPANHAKLSRYQEIARRLATAQGVGAEEAAQLAEEGKAVVWIDGGLHASEVLCAQAVLETIYQLVTGNDAETRRILDDVIILFVHCNPDGMDLCADWYMREADQKKRSLANLPRLYEKYAGHDNNRDFYANILAETKNMNRVMYREWFPQIVLNQHQTGPAGAVIFIPPCRDPFNYNINPLVIGGIEAVSTAMVQRFLAEGKPGATVRTGARYSTWFNGGLSTTCQFHNMIGLFTETIGSPTPAQVPLVPAKLLPNSDYLAPITPQPWHFRQSIDYTVTANKALLDYAARNRQHLLQNIWVMGKDAIERGSRDNWSITPKIVAAARATRANPAPAGGGGQGGQGQGDQRGQGGQGGQGGRGGRGGIAGGEAEFKRLFRDPAKRDARGYILPADQPDFLTATKFINTLIGTGLTVHRARADFEVAGKKYPAGSYVVKSAQAFRAHLFDMFEPQDHPDDFAYPGAPPTPPYDMAGWTLAYQMGVKFDRILDGFDGPFEELKDEVPPPPARVDVGAGDVGFVLDTRLNDAFHAVNRLLKEGEDVRRLREPISANGTTYPAGTFFIMRKPTTLGVLEKIAAEMGTPFVGSTTASGDKAVSLKSVRVGLWDRYGGSMPSGWTRLLLERFEFPFQVVYAPELDKGGLREKYDVLIFVDGAIGGGFGGGRGGRGGGGGASGGGRGGAGGDQPPSAGGEFQNQRGNITIEKTVPQLRKFLEAGGTILTLGSSTDLARQLGLPLGNHLVTKDNEGRERPLGRDKFYVPGSLLRIRLDTTNPLAWGMDEQADVMFISNPVFRLPEGADAKGLRRVAWFDSKTPLRSGWAWGQEHLEGGIALAEAPVGQGRLVLCGPQILFRGQPHGTFKLLFNILVQASIKP